MDFGCTGKFVTQWLLSGNTGKQEVGVRRDKDAEVRRRDIERVADNKTQGKSKFYGWTDERTLDTVGSQRRAYAEARRHRNSETAGNRTPNARRGVRPFWPATQTRVIHYR